VSVTEPENVEIDVSVPPPDPAAFGFIQLRSGATYPLMRRVAVSGSDPHGAARPTGVIYTDVGDMPSLEELLEQREVALAVLERPALAESRPVGQTRTPATGADRLSAPERTAALRLIAAAVIGTAISAVGWTLLASAVSGVRANPYTAVSLGLGGLVLLLTLLSALRETHPRR
jgi:hypothetical protein